MLFSFVLEKVVQDSYGDGDIIQYPICTDIFPSLLFLLSFCQILSASGWPDLDSC